MLKKKILDYTGKDVIKFMILITFLKGVDRGLGRTLGPALDRLTETIERKAEERRFARDNIDTVKLVSEE